ncbi:MAG: RNA polymerase sigma factor [Clostridia bacterium]|nr:RNA polymerase sigma factor [Clostridia bacterium]
MEQTDFQNAVDRNSHRLFLLALSFLQNHSDAEDVLQDVFLKLWLRTAPFENETHMDKFLTSVCVNGCRNLLRSSFRKRCAAPEEEALSLYTFDSTEDCDLFCAVMALPLRERTVVHLFYYEDMSVKEIAAALHIGQSAVKTALHRARNHLRECLKEDGDHA